MKKLILIDNNARKYVVKDPQRFYDHLIECHTKNKIIEHSVHEENGFYFTVTEDLFKKVEDFFIKQVKQIIQKEHEKIKFKRQKKILWALTKELKLNIK